MEWNRIWRFWQKENTAGMGKQRGSVIRREPRAANEWQGRLIELDVSQSCAARLAEKLRSAHGELGPGSAEGLLYGAMLTFAAHADEQASVERNLREVREVERLLGAFSGELEKLDEVLEVLAAYAQRMRSKPAKATRRVLH